MSLVLIKCLPIHVRTYSLTNKLTRQFEKEVSSKVAPLYTHRTAIDKGLSDTCVSVQFIESAIQSVKRNFAPGDDQVTYEHILYCGPLVHKVLAKLFSHMLTLCHMTKQMKVGTIITVYKLRKWEQE